MGTNQHVILRERSDRRISPVPGERAFASLRMTLAFLALVFGAGAVSAQATGAADPLAGRSKGSTTAPVTVYEMSDFQCPYCKKFAHETFPELDRRYIQTGKVRWVFINFPLTSIHPHAVPAAELAICAAKQGEFWRVHDLLFQYQENWAPLKEVGPFFVSLGDSAGLSKKPLLACLQSPETRKAVQAEAEGAERSGATSTPSFYIEGGLMAGAVPVEAFSQVLDSIYDVRRGKTGRTGKTGER
jgi:protein-disulfide isomerase